VDVSLVDVRPGEVALRVVGYGTTAEGPFTIVGNVSADGFVFETALGRET
jgi:hypothetical protein